jgi:hypothetical protein
MITRVEPRSLSPRFLALAVAAMSMAALHAATARAQSVLLDSFESPAGVSRWVAPGSPIYLRHEQSAIGATAGASSMLLEMEGNYEQFGWGALGGWAVQGDFLPADADPSGYNAFNTAAANPSVWNLLIDLTTNAGSWTDAPPVDDGGVNQAKFNIGFNSDGGFSSVAGPSVYNAQGKTTLVTRLSALAPTIVANSSFYQIQLGGENRFLPADPTTGVKYYIDRVRLRPVPFARTETLWSFETPDNPATTTVNEAFEGWDDLGLNQPAGALGDRFAHRHSVTTYAPTQGTKSLMVDTTGQNPANVYTVDGNQLSFPGYQFHWGSTYRLNADVNPDPMVVQIDPVIQAQINTLAGKLNSATAIQFDVTFSHPGGGAFVPGDPEPFTQDPTLPTFADFEMFIADSRGVFFQFDPGAFSAMDVDLFYNNTYAGAPLTPERTLTLPLASLTNRNGATQAAFPNAATGFPADLTSLSIGIATNGGPIVAHIDNIRLVIDLRADFNFDGVVNQTDLGIWKTATTTGTEGGDADNDGDSDGADFLLWQRELGLTGTRASVAASAPVPEPASAVLAALGLLTIRGLVRRSKTSTR